MGKKYFLCFLSVLSVFLFSPNVKAEEDTSCNYNSRAYLNKIASSVKASYDFKYESDGSISFDISVYNITDEIYVSYRSDLSEEETKIFASMASDGTYTFNVKDIDNIITYTFTVRSINYGCTHNIRTFTLIKPKWNSYSDLDICKYEALEDYFYCQKWISQELEGTNEAIIKKINDKRNSLRKSTTTRCIECEKEEKEKSAREEYLRRKYLMIGSLSIGIILDICAIIFMIVRIRRYSI